MIVVALAGPAGSGKDTAAQAIAAAFGLTIRHLADPIRATLALPIWRQALAMTGPDAPRRAAQAVGDAFRALAPDLLVQLALADGPAETLGFVIPDVRLPAEAAALRALSHAWLIYCDTAPSARVARLQARDGHPLSLAAAQHPTETMVGTLADFADFRWANSAPFDTTWPVLRQWLATRIPVSLA